MDFAIGTQVEYGRPNGVKLTGEIIKVNQKSYLIKYPSVWNVGSGKVRVSKSLVRIVNPVQAEPVQAEPVQVEPVQVEPVQAQPSEIDELKLLSDTLKAENTQLRNEIHGLRRENNRFKIIITRIKNAMALELTL